MANGFSLGLLKFTQEVSKKAAPDYKVHPRGFLAKLLITDDPTAFDYDAGNGHYRPIKVKHKQRFTAAQTTTTPGCDVTNTNPYIEESISVTGFRQLAFHIQNSTIAQFDIYASQKSGVGGATPNFDLMYEFLDTLKTAANGLLEAVNSDLVTTALANAGVHRGTGSANPITLNLPLSTATNAVNAGINKLMYDYKFNGFSGRPQVVGSGLMGYHVMQQVSKGLDAAGIDTRIQTGGIDFWWDEDLPVVASAANRIAVYEPNAVQLIEYKRYRGPMWSDTPGASKFGGLVIPMVYFDGKEMKQVPVYFDWQLRFNDCDVEMPYVDGEESVLLQPGYNLILSKTFDLYTLSTTRYRTGDVLEGNRGSLLYNVTNA